MNLKTMRAVDFWAGVPICFLSTQLLRLAGPSHSAASATDKPKRILFIQLSEMGATIVSNPAMRKAQQAFDAEVFFLIFRRNVECLHLLQSIPAGNIVTIREDSLWTLTVDTFRFLRWARRHAIDTVIDLEMFSRYSALLTGFSGAVRRVGYYRFHAEGLYRGEMLTHRVSFNPYIHMAKNFLSLINSLLAPPDEVPFSKTPVADCEIQVPLCSVSDSEQSAMYQLVHQVLPAFDRRRHRLVLLNPNSSELVPQRRWPRDRFVELARLILAEWDDVFILLTGSPAERAESLGMEAEVNDPRLRSFAGRHNLRALIPLYHLGSLLITNDSGPAHFSAVTPIRSIVLFGPETPSLYGSLGDTESITAGLPCSPCVSAANNRNTACNDPVCMRQILPERVMVSVEAVLGSPGRLYAIQTPESVQAAV